MSKGLSKLQRLIVGILDGSVRPQAFSSGGALTTVELAEELLGNGLFEGTPHKQRLATIRRACDSLCRRNLIGGTYTHDYERGGYLTICWKASK